MPDFIYARQTFYPVASETEVVYLCDSEEAVFSFIKLDYPEHTHVDGVTIAHTMYEEDAAEKFREWIKSTP